MMRLYRESPTPGQMVFRQQPGPQYCQDNRDHHRLQESKENPSPPTPHTFLGLHITNDISWTLNSTHQVQKAQLRLFFLRKLKKVRPPTQLLANFYRTTAIQVLSD